MRYLIFTSRDSTRKRVMALLLLLWLCLLALWNSLVWSSGALGGVLLSDVPSRDGPQNVASLIEGLHLSAEHPASENFVFERCVLNNAVPAKLYSRNHSSVEEYSELGRRACMIQNAAFYPVLQRTIVETASLCCPHAGMVNFVRGMLDINKTEVTFRERRRGNLEINNIENGRLTMDYSLNALARKVE
ncbi:hypothetical protein T02_16340 [Trichinella nativa]|uniref:Uncharacterized protein n=1 Tax=Trichinella nativa TaxID=6335 RepID=A0A0V1LUW8_9BILA|nr:hypothetical protein T02_16340 [Trichinella nativa]